MFLAKSIRCAWLSRVEDFKGFQREAGVDVERYHSSMDYYYSISLCKNTHLSIVADPYDTTSYFHVKPISSNCNT